MKTSQYRRCVGPWGIVVLLLFSTPASLPGNDAAARGEDPLPFERRPRLAREMRRMEFDIGYAPSVILPAAPDLLSADSGPVSTGGAAPSAPSFPPLISMDGEPARQDPARSVRDPRNWLVDSILGAPPGQEEPTDAVDSALRAIRGDSLFSPQDDNWLGVLVQVHRSAETDASARTTADTNAMENHDGLDPISRLLAGDFPLDDEGRSPGRGSASHIGTGASGPVLDPILGVRLGQTLERFADEGAEWRDARTSGNTSIEGPLPVSSFSFRDENARPAAPAETNAPGADPWANLVVAPFDPSRGVLTSEAPAWQSTGLSASAVGEDVSGGSRTDREDSGLFRGMGEQHPNVFAARDLRTGVRAPWDDGGEARGSLMPNDGRWDAASRLGSPRDEGNNAWDDRARSAAGPRAFDARGDAWSSPVSSTFDRMPTGSRWDPGALPSAWDSGSRFDTGQTGIAPSFGTVAPSAPPAFPRGPSMPGSGSPFGGMGPGANPLAPTFLPAGPDPAGGTWGASLDPLRGR